MRMKAWQFLARRGSWRGLALGLPVLLAGVMAGCVSSPQTHRAPTLVPPWVGLIEGEGVGSIATGAPTRTPVLVPIWPQQPIQGSPTPDVFRTPPPLRTEALIHYVQPGESLSILAERYSVSTQTLLLANGITNADFLAVGQRLVIPPPVVQPAGPAYKILPDSEVVFGPASVGFDVVAEAARRGGYLAYYRETVEEEPRDGAAIVQLVAERYSVNPRLLLALLEYQSGWLTHPDVQAQTLSYPLGYQAQGWEGLFAQLSWAADMLNRGYYAWRAGWAGPYLLADGSVVPAGPGINAGTAAVQMLFAQLDGADRWRWDVGPDGLAGAYEDLFGSPFSRRVEPLVPENLEQPEMQLPFEPGKAWSFTGGPHSAWGDWAAWAALDFAPPGQAYGCVTSDEWLVAAADGLVVRSGDGAVLLDLDGDGFEQTGWVLLYLHIETRDRVPAGVFLKAGDRIGHPSCEGGVTTGTHVHLARKYNGEWIPADGDIPFNLDGWVSSGAGVPYDGFLRRGAQELEACACRNEFNQIMR